MLRTTVKILRVFVMKGTICCLNCFTNRQIKIWPPNERTPVNSRSLRYSLWLIIAEIHGIKSPVIMRKIMVRKVVHLFTQTINTVGCGLNLYLTTAWKSGKKPSASSETIIKTMPKIQVLCYYFELLGSFALKMSIPKVTRRATIILFLPNFKAVSFTPLNNTPTNATERILHERIIITTGKFVKQIAQLQVIVEITTAEAHFSP